MHHKIALSPQSFSTAFDTDFSYIKATHIDVLENGIIEHKDAVLEKAYKEYIDRNKIVIVSSCNKIKKNNILFRIYGNGNHCLMKHNTLINILEWLQDKNFLQVHESFIINKLYATFISPHFEIYLSDIIVPIGREFYDKVDSTFLSGMQFKQIKSHHKKDLK